MQYSTGYKHVDSATGSGRSTALFNIQAWPSVESLLKMFLLYMLLGCAVAVVAMVVLTVALYYRLKFLQLPRYRIDSFMTRARVGPMAHRGGRPENTLAGIARSHKLGASGIEVDLAFTKDGEPVLLHDSRIDRTSNGSGRVQNMTLSELRKLDFGIKTGG